MAILQAMKEYGSFMPCCQTHSARRLVHDRSTNPQEHLLSSWNGDMLPRSGLSWHEGRSSDEFGLLMQLSSCSEIVSMPSSCHLMPLWIPRRSGNLKVQAETLY